MGNTKSDRVRSLMIAYAMLFGPVHTAQCAFCWYVMHKTIQCIRRLALIALLNAHRCAFERAIVDGIRNFNYSLSF